MIRAFLAIVLGEAILERYSACHAREATQRRDFRWVRPANVHITIRFLGDTREDRVEPLRREIESVTAGAAPFRIALGQPGCFGPRDRPQVLWFAIDEGAQELKALVTRIESALRRLSFAPDDKAWRAHITVARNPRRAFFRDWEEALKGWGLAGMAFEAREVTFFSSVLGPQGPTYSVLWNAALGGGGEHTTQDPIH